MILVKGGFNEREIDFVVPAVGKGLDRNFEGHVIVGSFRRLLGSEHVHERVVEVKVKGGFSGAQADMFFTVHLDAKLGYDEKRYVRGLSGDEDVFLD